MDKDALLKRIQEIEDFMGRPDFWADKHKAQALIKELQELKEKQEGKGKYDKGDAILTIFSGAGGDDAEDFTAILFNMYRKFCEKNGYGMTILHEHGNDHGGFRNISAEIKGKDAYGRLKNESGVHRLVRISPFNSKGQRHTSFSLVEIVPKLEEKDELKIPPEEFRIEFSRSSGPGGQNVNKRETAVRIVHIPTNFSASAETERSQAQNKERAMQMVLGKIYKFQEEQRRKEEAGLAISKTTDIEWGNQIRSYVIHPYKLVKDHRTDVEVHNPESVFDGEIEPFLEAERML